MEQCSYIQPEAMEGASLQPIREIIEAGMRGEKKKIAALGASVSKGETVKKGNAFLNKMEQKWESYFPGSTVPEFINASVSGTFSANALLLWMSCCKRNRILFFWITVSMTRDSIIFRRHLKDWYTIFWKTERMSVSFCFVIKMGTALEGR